MMLELSHAACIQSLNVKPTLACFECKDVAAFEHYSNSQK